MSHELDVGSPEKKDLATEVGEAGAALIEVINYAPSSPKASLHRKLKISLAHLVAEIKSVDVVLALGRRVSLQLSLEKVARAFDEILCIRPIATHYAEALKKAGGLRSRRFNFIAGFLTGQQKPPSVDEIINEWIHRSLPSLGMFHKLVQHTEPRELSSADLLTHDGDTIKTLIKSLKKWNDLVDQVYGGDEEDEQPSNPYHEPPRIEEIFHKKDSAYHLSRSLYNILHKNWPCQLDGHNQEGCLGLCQGAKVYLDPQWGSKERTNDGFFMLLTGPNILQQCRVHIESGCLEGNDPICLAAHDDHSRSVCLHLGINSNNQLWDNQTSAQPLEIFMDGEEYVDMSLGQLLTAIKPTYAAKRVIGVTLARCMLHLLEGPWLKDSTSIDDVFVYCRTKNGELYPMFEKTFIATHFKHNRNQPTPESSNVNYRIHPFPTIMALGIILIEIELGEDILEIKNDPSFTTKKHKPFYVAKHLLEEFRKRFNMDSGLLQAVKFCTDRLSMSQFRSLDCKTLLSNQDFIDVYYNKIVRPLEEDLVNGANWTWDQVAHLRPPSLTDSGICKVFTKPAREHPLNLPPKWKLGLDQEWDSTSSRTSLSLPNDANIADNASYSPDHAKANTATATITDLQPYKYVSAASSATSIHAHVEEFTTPVGNSAFIPSSRDDFQIVIICALQIEANAVQELFDQSWDEQGVYQFGKQPKDTNSYSAGKIGNHNVVLAHQPRMGKATAANLASGCLMSFTQIKLALLVGICGGVPAPHGNEEILLGDVVFSKGIVQYDFGRRYPDKFLRKSTVDDQLGRPDREISSLLSRLETTIQRINMETKIAGYLDNLESSTYGYRQVLYPGEQHDKLFDPEYIHKHHELTNLKSCEVCINEACDVAMDASCKELHCDVQYLINRSRKNQKNRPFVHFGLIASGDTVLKSGLDRDNIAKETKVIAFEMEGSGVWDTMPCVVIKGVCDYADSHKNKLWQEYAARTAAAAGKAFLRHWTTSA
ncbi:hypothetical protein N7456_001051 [Penicillium angulare]|uniref:Nucleoside phosphorylase domain-containing protein n=1 Tax=Penicillium angulare TaxID=116970 RepID=A0A9W9KSG3_9EURO|nr:hypothetical protein N7456_001051 [Penicillium angulare]